MGGLLQAVLLICEKSCNRLQILNCSSFQHLPVLFQEVLNAQFKVLPLTVPQCGKRGCVLQLPFLSSPYFQSHGKSFVNSALVKAGGHSAEAYN